MSSSLFRSEEMTFIQLYIPLEIAQQTVWELGENGQIEFRDLNPEINPFQRTFVSEIKRLDGMERIIRFLKSEADKSNVKVKSLDKSFPIPLKSFQELSEIENQLEIHEARLLQMNESKVTLSKRLLELTELLNVLKETSGFFEENEAKLDDRFPLYREDSSFLSPGNYDDGNLERGDGPRGDTSLGFIAGVLARARMPAFEKIMFRALRGNLYLNHAEISEDITDPTTEVTVKKNVFIIFAQGSETLAKIKKLCESLNATIYPVDSTRERRRENSLEVVARIEDLKHVLENTLIAKKGELISVAQDLDFWSSLLKKEKSVYHTMNFFNYDQNRKALIAEGWCPTHSLNSVGYCLKSVMERTNSTIPPLMNELRTNLTPPTYHRTNKFTVGFQEIVDAYGVATYREVNPGLFAIVTFPFLFAVMFGDVGHGLIVSLFAIWMCYYEKSLERKKWGEIWSTFFGGRYIILLMGLFSLYTGIIYNDAFSQTVSFFKSAITFTYDETEDKWIGKQTRSYPYVIGVDRAWHGAENYLLFSNSYKMKMSILFGVCQMSFGVVLSLLNHRFFRRSLSIYTEFLPQIIFLESIFGYLSILIIYKWMAWSDPSTAPGLLNTLIYMFLKPGTVEAQLYAGQSVVQTILLIIAFLCVPWMLLVKPYILYQKSKKPVTLQTISPNSEVESHEGLLNVSASPAHGDHGEHEHFELGEVMIHQMIHTIEFCLGAISNTASYLRLWALSLAHAQLSEVLWTMILANGLTMEGPLAPIMVFVAFAFWFILTVGILCGMEGLSAFLHALRLHWVEFNGKFYQGTGQKFEPFSFSAILQDAPEE